MSNYDIKYPSSISLMGKRLYGTSIPAGEPLHLSVAPPKPESTDVLDPAIEGFKDQAALLEIMGGFQQQERMIYDKRKSLDKALLYSYQGANIIKVTEDAEEVHPTRALINSNKLKPDYDDKVLSVPYEYNFQPGDIFKWMNTDTYWIIYLQDLTELAYFRGDIRKCSHTIAYQDEDGFHTTYAAIRGPVETKINSIQKIGISVDNPNYSLNILIPKTKSNLEYFRRYSKFYFNNAEEGSPDICWRVEAVNWISMPGVIEIVAVEYYRNDMDDIRVNIDDDMGSVEIEPIAPDESDRKISGASNIKPKKEYKYTATSIATKEWSVLSGVPVKLRVDPEDSKSCYVTWVSGFSGEFDLYFGQTKKHIIVDSLF